MDRAPVGITGAPVTCPGQPAENKRPHNTTRRGGQTIENPFVSQTRASTAAINEDHREAFQPLPPRPAERAHMWGQSRVVPDETG
jgi:hypothetical protein